MLSERFLSRLGDAFPAFYDRANVDALADAERLLKDASGSVERALHRARFEGAGRLWWPYLKGAVPVVGNERAAMESFTRLILTVDHIVGHPPASREDARAHVVEVLRKSIDIERLRRVVMRETKEHPGATAGGVFASMSALMAPLSSVGTIRKWARFVPAYVLVIAGGVIVAALLSVPLVAGYSAGHQAERIASSLPGTTPARTAAERATELPHRRAVP